MESTQVKSTYYQNYKKKVLPDGSIVIAYKSMLHQRAGLTISLAIVAFLICLFGHFARPALDFTFQFIFIIFVFLLTLYQNPYRSKIKITKEGIYFTDIRNIFNESFLFKYTKKCQLTHSGIASICLDDDGRIIINSKNTNHIFRITGFLKNSDLLVNEINKSTYQAQQ